MQEAQEEIIKMQTQCPRCLELIDFEEFDEVNYKKGREDIIKEIDKIVSNLNNPINYSVVWEKIKSEIKN